MKYSERLYKALSFGRVVSSLFDPFNCDWKIVVDHYSLLHVSAILFSVFFSKNS